MADKIKQKHSLLARILRISAKSILFLFVLILLIFGIINLPVTQKFLTKKAATYFSETLNTKVEIDYVGWKLPKQIFLEKVYIETPAGNSLFTLGSLEIGVNLFGLIQQKVQVDRVGLQNLQADIFVRQDTSNIAFIIDAFTSDNDSSHEIDTTNSASSWQFLVSDALLDLQNIDVIYDDSLTGLKLDLDLQKLAIDLGEVDISNKQFLLDDITLNKADISYIAYPTTSSGSAKSTLDYTIGATKVNLNKVHFATQIVDMELKLSLDTGYSKDLNLNITDNGIAVQTQDIKLTQTDFKYDIVTVPKLSDFDPNHLNFKDLNLDADNLDYEGTDIEISVNQLSGNSDDRLLVKDLKGAIIFNERGVKLQDFVMKTDDSDFAKSEVDLAFNFLDAKANLENMGLDISVPRGSLAPKDLLYFSPDLKPFLEKAAGNLNFKNTKITGSLRDMQVTNVNFSGFGSNLQANGRIENVLQTDLLAMNLRIDSLVSEGDILKDFLPKNTLPLGTELPKSIHVSGNLEGSLAEVLNIDLQAKTRRTDSPAMTEIDFDGSFNSLLSDTLAYDLNIYKFTSDDTELNAYLPTGMLPSGYVLPTKIDVTGSLKGTLNSVSPKLILQAKTPIGQAYIRTQGDINNFSNPNFNFSLAEIQVDTNFLNYVLPDNLLPAGIRLPDIENGTLYLRGNLANLKANAKLKTSAGQLTAKVEGDDKIYDFSTEIDALNLLKITSGSLRDSLARTNLNPLNLNINGQGRNLDNFEIATGKAKIQVKEIESNYAGLQTDIRLKPNEVKAKVKFSNLSGIANLDISYNLKNEYTARGNLQKLNLKNIPYLRIPVTLGGNLDISTRYDSLSRMTADVLLEQFNFRYNEKNYPLNRLKTNVNFNGKSKNVILRSDWVNANVLGNFAFADLSDELENFVNTYLKQGQNNTLKSSSDTKLSVIANWTNTAFLTAGIVSGLEEIEPFKLKVDFSAAEDKLTVDLNFPKIVYAGNEINLLTGNAETAAEALNYTFEIHSLQIVGADNMGKVQLQGDINDGLLTAHLVDTDTTNTTSLDLTALLDAKDEGYRLRFEKDVVLNDKSWNFNPKNELIYTPQNIRVNDWELSNGEQRLTLESISAEQIQANFQEFKIEEVLSVIQLQDLASGRLNGAITVDDPLQDLRIAADLDLKNTVLYGSLLGDAHIELDNRQKSDAYAIDFSLNGAGNDAKIKGIYDLGNPVDPLNFIVDIKSLQLKPFETFSNDLFSNMQGHLVTQAEVLGAPDALSLVGFLQVKEASATIKELGTPLKFGEQKIDLEGNVIRFRNFSVLDSTNNEALVSAFIITEDFREYEYDLDVSAKNFLVLNTTVEDNDLYYGKIYVDAIASIKGDLFSPVIEATASPREGSDLTYVLPASSTTLDYGEGVVTFVDGIGNQEEKLTDTIRSEVAQALHLTVTVNLEINDNLNFTAIVDPITDSKFSGKGEGFLSFAMFPSGKMEMSGTFTMKEGIYNFVYAELVKRSFDIVSGSTMTWSGDIYNPSLDVKVQYKVKVSPLPLVSSQSELSESQSAALRASQTFIVQLNITGSLEKTDIETTLLYPDINENTKNSEIIAAVNRLQQNPNSMNEQAFGLILFNGFVSENLNLGAGILNAQSNINDAISGQLNNLANRYIKFVDLDFGLDNYDNYDATSGETYTRTNLNLKVSKRFFQDRLVVSIDGETSNGSLTDNSQSQVYLDNLTVEYSLTKSGNWRIKVYNKRDQNDDLAPDILRTGAALVISKDFNELRFFKKKKK